MPAADTPRDLVRPIVRARQYREFTDAPVSDAEVDAVVDAARWSGSSGNEQPWRFIVIRDVATLRRLAALGMPQTRGLHTAVAAIAIVLPDDSSRGVSYAYDDGRAAERILIAATMLGMGSGISWIRAGFQPAMRKVLGLPEDRIVRTIMSLGHPTEAARQPKSAPGQGRPPRDEMVIQERWPAE
jgi:nitroreductase